MVRSKRSLSNLQINIAPELSTSERYVTVDMAGERDQVVRPVRGNEPLAIGKLFGEIIEALLLKALKHPPATTSENIEKEVKSGKRREGTATRLFAVVTPIEMDYTKFELKRNTQHRAIISGYDRDPAKIARSLEYQIQVVISYTISIALDTTRPATIYIELAQDTTNGLQLAFKQTGEGRA